MQTNQLQTKRRDPRLALTDALQVLAQTPAVYGLLVSQHIYNMLEMRAAGVSTDAEVSLLNRMPVAVDKSFPLIKWETVATREEWLKRTASK
jgi:hypothetical protein